MKDDEAVDPAYLSQEDILKRREVDYARDRVAHYAERTSKDVHARRRDTLTMAAAGLVGAEGTYQRARARRERDVDMLHADQYELEDAKREQTEREAEL